MIASTINGSKDSSSTALTTALFCIILALIGVMKWQFEGQTAFEGPGLDMVGFFERSADANYLVNDYFVNASMSSNPKLIFGYVVNFFAKQFGVQWYSIFFALKVLMVMIVPMTWFLLLISLMKRIEPTRNLRIIDFLAAALLVVWAGLDPLLPSDLSVRKWFSIGWWFPYLDSVAPHCIAIIFGLWSIISLTIKQPFRWLSIPLYFLCTLLHPAIGFVSLLFLALIEFAFESSMKVLIKKIAPYMMVFLLVGLSISFFYKPSVEVTAREASDVYIYLGHASHYLPSNFGSLSGYTWYLSLSLNLIFLGCGLIGKPRKLPKLRKWVFGSILLILGVIFWQDLIAKTAFSKGFVFLGPARFLFYSFWLGACSVCLALREQSFSKLSSSKMNSAGYLGLLVVPIVFLLVLLMRIQIDSPKDKIEIQNPSLFTWIRSMTPESAVFLVPFGDLTQSVPFVGRRAIFAGAGFPFTEEYFTEYKKRESFAFGNFDERNAAGGGWVGEKMSRVYRSRSPRDVLEISRNFRIDFVIREKKYLGGFEQLTPAYIDENFAIFSMKDIQKLEAHD